MMRGSNEIEMELLTTIEAKLPSTELVNAQNGLEILAALAQTLCKAFRELHLFEEQIFLYEKLLKKAREAENQIAEAIAHQSLIEIILNSYSSTLCIDPMILKKGKVIEKDVEEGVYEYVPEVNQLYRWKKNVDYVYFDGLNIELNVAYQALRAYANRVGAITDNTTLDGVIVDWINYKVPIATFTHPYPYILPTPMIIGAEKVILDCTLMSASVALIPLGPYLIICDWKDDVEMLCFVIISSWLGLFSLFTAFFLKEKFMLEATNPAINIENRVLAALIGGSLGAGIGLGLCFAISQAMPKNTELHDSPLTETGILVFVSTTIVLSLLATIAVTLHQQQMQKRTTYVEGGKILLSKPSLSDHNRGSAVVSSKPLLQ